VSSPTGWIAANETRVDFCERFEALIEAYNAGSIQIEQCFRKLLEKSRDLTDEETATSARILRRRSLWSLISSRDPAPTFPRRNATR